MMVYNRIIMKADKLLICAHPDDETLFFGGLLLQNPGEFKVICVTDANADGRALQRMDEFHKALDRLGVCEYEVLGLSDIYEQRLDLQELKNSLKDSAQNSYKEVYTHNIIGEYGHPHHQDVSFCVHELFNCPVYSCGYNTFPDKVISLTKDQYEIKSEICTQIYGEETRRFLNLLPVTFAEGFILADFDEVKQIYEYFTKQKDLGELKKFNHLRSYLINLKNLNRPF